MRYGRSVDRMVVVITIHAISDYHHWRCEFLLRRGHNMFLSNLHNVVELYQQLKEKKTI
jgi:hypothetical protein